MKILSRYVVREHIGPFTFALTALTSLMLLNFISRQFGELVGKGLSWKVIGEFFLLSIPFTIALTVPMSVLVSVLYAYTRLASENEVTALKANGVSPWRLVAPAIVSGVFMSIALLAFNDQVLPRANHELKTLQDDISQTKPTLLLKEQVINSIAEGKFYLKADKIDRAGERLFKVVIYDLADPTRRRTIEADSGHIAFTANKVDLDLDLFHGEMHEVSTDKPTQLNRMFYMQDRIRIRDVGKEFKETESTQSSKGDREMGICEMQQRLWSAQAAYAAAKRDFDDALKPQQKPDAAVYRTPPKTPEPHGIGWAYCSLLRAMGQVRVAHAAEVSDVTLHRVSAGDTIPKVPPTPVGAVQPVQDTVKKDTIKKDTTKKDTTSKKDTTAKAAGVFQAPVPPAAAALPPMLNGSAQALADSQAAIAARAAAQIMQGSAKVAAEPKDEANFGNSRKMEAKIRLEMAQRGRDRFEIEIHKKFSLAAACLIFCIVAPPIALRFPRGGVGLVIGVSLAVFALYYVGLIGGESAANKGLVQPFWAMWGTNVIMTLVGIILLLRMGHDFGSARGGGLRDWLHERRMRREERRSATAVPRVA